MQNLSLSLESLDTGAARRLPFKTAHLGLALLAVTALTAGCREDGLVVNNMTMDLAMPEDLARPVARDLTIRDLNSPTSNLKAGDRVHLTGVVVSPQTWISSDDKAGFCYYRVFAMQADGSPTTIRDGLAVTLGLKTTFGDMSRITECSRLAKMDAIGTTMLAVKPGDEVEIEGKYSLRGSGATATRQIDVYKGTLNDKGAAAMMPVPLDADPMTYQPAQTGLPQAFADAQGVLVTFANVKVNTRDMMYQDFNASTTDMGGARIATNFLRVTNATYMSPMNGTVLKSVTGIVTGDFKGTIWPRTEADITQ